MATDTGIQFLDILNTDGSAVGAVMNRYQDETFIAAGAITLGHWVEFDNDAVGYGRTATVQQAAAVGTVGNTGAFGVAMETVADGEEVRVRISGYCPTAFVPAACVERSALVGPITVAGQAAIEVPATTSGNVIATAAEADAVAPNGANFAAVYIKKQF